ncbi:conserved membrane hypothetical protein [Candidatus Terasakiella magnetica]|uniref:DUF4956 domain-containing protein n=1 Tax=Candidatus Terasakiella magnetica TaxID=1867952 RepID=A0A1C3RG52_9PROT|nr:DUF4956 domain-containing protein [Candidatus Terasakiella magnetica]SCA56235.1 conserved membrane hypothetical protein [Candidatus Terasakiella magnetica]
MLPSTVMNTQSIAISLVDLLISLSVSVGLGVFSAGIYRWTHRGLTYERTFLVTLVLIPAIVGLVMMLIGSNLALSLGLVGALSIIRFRTVIKDSRDMIFLFWGIAVGLGCGTYNWTVVVVSSIFFAIVVIVLHYLEYGKQRFCDCVLVLEGVGELPEDAINEIAKKYVLKREIRNFDMQKDEFEAVMELRLKNTDIKTQQELLSSLKELEGINKASLLAPRVSLPL